MGWGRDSPLTINISINGRAMRYIRETPCPKLEIKRQTICFYVHEMLWHINCSRWALNHKNTDSKTYKRSSELRWCKQRHNEQLVLLYNCWRKILVSALLCSVLKIWLEKFIKQNLRMVQVKIKPQETEETNIFLYLKDTAVHNEAV